MQCLALGDRLLGDPPLARPARRRRLGELGPVHVLDRVDLGQEELLRQLVPAVHLNLGRGEWNTDPEESLCTQQPRNAEGE